MFNASARVRHIRLALIAAALSILSVIAAAWGSAAWLDYDNTIDQLQGSGLSDSEWWHLSRNSVVGGVRYTSVVMIRATNYKPSVQQIELPAWATLLDPPVLGQWPNDFYEIVEGRGWPWPCLSYRFSGRGRAPVRAGTVQGGLALSPFKTGAWYSPRVLPYTPIWAGLAGNVAVHFTVWFAALAVIIEGRRACRRWRGRCMCCNYSLRSLTTTRCPECGTATHP